MTIDEIRADKREQGPIDRKKLVEVFVKLEAMRASDDWMSGDAIEDLCDVLETLAPIVGAVWSGGGYVIGGAK